jgi:putative redox protein
MITELMTRTPIATVRHEGGKRFSAETRGHTVLTDQPMESGGTDIGPTPLELIGIALGSCIALYVEQFCSARRIETEGLRVDVSQTTAKTPSRVASYDVALHLPPGFPDRYREAVQHVARSCPVHNTLAYAPAIHVDIDDGWRIS